MIQYIFYSFLNIILFVYLGLGLTLLITPKQLRRYSLFLSPLVGYSFCTLLGWYFYRFDFAGTDTYAWIFLLPPAVFLYFVFRKMKRHAIELIQLFEKSLQGPLVVGLISFFTVSLPFIVGVKNLTAMSLYNNDICAYSAASNFIKGFARSDTQGILGQWGFSSWVEGEVFGSFFASAFSSSILGLETYQVQNLICALFFSVSVTLVYVLAREVFGYNYSPALCASALFGLSPIMFYTIYNGFLSQIIAVGLSLSLFLIYISAFQSCKKLSEYFVYVPLAVFFNWGFIISYPHMLVFVLMISLIYLFGMQLAKKEIFSAWRGVVFLLSSLVFAGCLSLYRAWLIVQQMIRLGTVSAGWHLPWFSPDKVFGFILSGHLQAPNSRYVSVFLSCAICIVVLLGFLKIYKEKRIDFFVLGSGFLVIAIGYVALAYLDRLPNEWGGYKSYKFLSFFLPIILLSCLIFFRKLEWLSKNRLRYVSHSFLILLVGGSFFSSALIVKQMVHTPLRVKKTMAGLKNADNLPHVTSVNVLGGNWWEIMWATNFLFRKKVYRETPTYYPAATLDGEWDLIKCSADEEKLQSQALPGEMIRLNSKYMLCKASHIPPRINERLSDSDFKAELSLGAVNTSDVIKVGQEFNLPVKVKNVSNLTWYKEVCNVSKFPIRLGTHWLSKDGGLVIFDGKRTCFLRDVIHGEEVGLNAEVVAPEKPGEYILEIDLVQEYVAWFNDKGVQSIQIPVTVQKD